MLRTVILFALLATVKTQTTQVEQCINNAGPLPINTYIEGCITPPCVLPQLQNALINIIFKAPYTMKSMRTVATAYLNILPIPIQYDLGDNALTCNFIENSYCPVMKDEVIIYKLKMFIESFFPVGTQATIEFRVQDDNNSPILCIRVPIRITAAVDPTE